VTLKVREGLPSLRSVSVVRTVEASFRRGCERKEFRLAHYSIQGDHLHALVEADGPEALGRGMKSLAARFALAVNRALGRHGPVLRDRYHHRVLRTPREVRRALAYVLLNARRHAAKRRRIGVQGSPVRLDPASSARWFEGWRRAVRSEAPRAASPPAVARPRTWLLLVGWRRWGLLDPAEVPGVGSETGP
jgi:REP element-mobilizing transposase RayT